VPGIQVGSELTTRKASASIAGLTPRKILVSEIVPVSEITMDDINHTCLTRYPVGFWVFDICGKEAFQMRQSTREILVDAQQP
jgi:hypothetical protein